MPIAQTVQLYSHVFPDDVTSLVLSNAPPLFSVRCMLYGFGDDEQPYAETVDLLEDLVVEYIADTVSRNSCISS